MFGLDPTVLMMIVLAACAAGGVAYALLFNTIEQERDTTRRLKRVQAAETDRAAVKAARDRMQEANKRRKSIQDSLKDLEDKQKAREKSTRSPPLRILMQQAGLSMPMRQFYMFSVAVGAVIALLIFMTGAPLYLVPGAFLAGAFGLPRWFVAFLRKRRMAAFLNEFPNALDVMVRSVKSGLPLNDAIRLIAGEAQEPVRTEFRKIVESQQVGMSVPDACGRLFDRVPLPEANFFAIVIQIQSQAGGNLSEALGNLSRVLRDRKKMKAKVAALSMEAKASAAIIGALPFIVTVLVYLTSPSYIMLLFTDNRGILIVGASLVWMSIGVLVMKKMVSFDI